MKISSLFILTILTFFIVFLVIYVLFQSSVLDATVVEDGVTRVAYCFVQRQLFSVFAAISLLSFMLGTFWGDFIHPSENQHENTQASISKSSI